MNIGEAFRVAQCIAQGSLSRFQGGFRAAQPGIGGDKEDGGKAIRAAKKRTEGKANRAAKKKSTLLFARFPPDAWLTETQDTARIECDFFIRLIIFALILILHIFLGVFFGQPEGSRPRMWASTPWAICRTDRLSTFDFRPCCVLIAFS